MRARRKFETPAKVLNFTRAKDRAGLDGPVTSKVVRRPLRISRELEKLLRADKKK